MEFGEIIERLNYIAEDSDSDLCDEDVRALKEAVFWLKCKCIGEDAPDDTRIENLREYAANNVGSKVWVNFDCSDITICGSEEDYFKNVERLNKTFKSGLFTIIDETTIVGNINRYLALDINHNFISSVYPYTKEEK